MSKMFLVTILKPFSVRSGVNIQSAATMYIMYIVHDDQGRSCEGGATTYLAIHVTTKIATTKKEE